VHGVQGIELDAKRRVGVLRPRDDFLDSFGERCARLRAKAADGKKKNAEAQPEILTHQRNLPVWHSE
jgi:hypothetical protein